MVLTLNAGSASQMDALNTLFRTPSLPAPCHLHPSVVTLPHPARLPYSVLDSSTCGCFPYSPSPPSSHVDAYLVLLTYSFRTELFGRGRKGQAASKRREEGQGDEKNMVPFLKRGSGENEKHLKWRKKQTDWVVRSSSGVLLTSPGCLSLPSR